jgi:hypothetical protein
MMAFAPDGDSYSKLLYSDLSNWLESEPGIDMSFEIVATGIL